MKSLWKLKTELLNFKFHLFPNIFFCFLCPVYLEISRSKLLYVSNWSSAVFLTPPLLLLRSIISNPSAIYADNLPNEGVCSRKPKIITIILYPHQVLINIEHLQHQPRRKPLVDNSLLNFCVIHFVYRQWYLKGSNNSI